MARCYHCGQSFDYEKNYGICPRCSTCNREEMPEKPQEEMNQRPKPQNARKTSGVSIAVFVCLVIGIAAGVIFPFVGAGSFMVKNVLQEGLNGGEAGESSGVEGTWDYEKEEAPDQDKKKQSAGITEKQAGEAFVLGDMTRCSISVKEAYILRHAGTVEQFPKGQNLVAVKVAYECPDAENYQYHEYMFSGTPYVGYQGVFKECANKFVMMDYAEEESISEELLDFWSMKENIRGSGIFLVFVPEGITEINFYMDSRVEDTNDISAIYSVPLEIKAEEV